MVEGKYPLNGDTGGVLEAYYNYLGGYYNGSIHATCVGIATGVSFG